MAEIIVKLTLRKTVAAASGATFDAIEAWIQTNITANLPADATEVHTYEILP